MASKKLFGYRDQSASSSPHRNPLSLIRSSAGGDGAGKFGDRAAGMEYDPMEEELLANLEDLAQKTDVLTHWADEMYEFVKAIPISKSFLRNLDLPWRLTPILRATT